MQLPRIHEEEADRTCSNSDFTRVFLLPGQVRLTQTSPKRAEIKQHSTPRLTILILFLPNDGVYYFPGAKRGLAVPFLSLNRVMPGFIFEQFCVFSIRECSKRRTILGSTAAHI